MSQPTAERRIPNGARVVWASTSAGSTVEKRGRVLAFLPCGHDLAPHVPRDVPRSRVKVQSATYRSKVDR